MQAKTRMEYGGLVLAALVVGGAYLLCLAAFFLWQGTLPPFTLAGSLGYLAVQIALALALRAGARVEGWIIALLGLHGTVPTIVLLLEACPCAAITTMFAIQFHHDEELAAGAVVFSTLSSILTLPLYALLLTMVLG